MAKGNKSTRYTVEYCYMDLEEILPRQLPAYKGERVHVVNIDLTRKWRPKVTLENGEVYEIYADFIPPGAGKGFRIGAASMSLRDAIQPMRPNSAILIVEGENDDDDWYLYNGYPLP